MDYDDIITEFLGAASAKNDSLYTALVRCMINERMAPELLPFQTTLMDRVLEALSSQQQWLLDCHELDLGDLEFKLQLMIAETELERLNYLVRVYLRTRLAKLDRFGQFYMGVISADPEQPRGPNELLLADEVAYLVQHFRLLNRLYNDSFLKKLPEKLQLLDDTKGGENMVELPDLARPVFFQYVGRLDVEIDLGGDDVLELTNGGIYVVRYSAIRQYLAIEDVILL